MAGSGPCRYLESGHLPAKRGGKIVPALHADETVPPAYLLSGSRFPFQLPIHRRIRADLVVGSICPAQQAQVLGIDVSHTAHGHTNPAGNLLAARPPAAGR